MLNSLSIFIGKLIITISKTLNLGSGSTWPGHIALIVNKNFVKNILAKNKKLKVVLIAGTNGKTTTSKLIQFLLEKNNIKVFHNEAGANLLNGIASTLIQYSDFKGKLPFDAAIFEIDENTLPLALEKINPYGVVILNLFRDQLDRYGEVNAIFSKWNEALKKIDKDTYIFLNGDDPQISFLGEKLNAKTYYFGISEKQMAKKEIPHDVDSIYCPNCSKRLTFKSMSYSHLGNFACNNCSYKRKDVEDFSDNKITYPLFGKYNIYNINSALLLLIKAFNIKLEALNKQLEDFKPAFGRQEVIKYKNKNIIVLLSKNPTGFNQSIEAINNFTPRSYLGKGTTLKKNALVVLNDRIPDGRDVSWIYDVDFENLTNYARKIFISGDRTYDMGIRIKYTLNEDVKIKKLENSVLTFNDKFFVIEDLQKAIDFAVSETQEDETLFILPTYSAMLDTRQILSGKKIL